MGKGPANVRERKQAASRRRFSRGSLPAFRAAPTEFYRCGPAAGALPLPTRPGGNFAVGPFRELPGQGAFSDLRLVPFVGNWAKEGV